MSVQAPLLSILLFFPVVSGVIMLLFPLQRMGALVWALATAIVEFIFAIYLITIFSSSSAGFQLAEHHVWIPSLGINYSLGVDGINIFLIGLTALLSCVAIGASYKEERSPKGYMFLMLTLETGIIGAFAATNLFLFYIFWELMLVPMYFLIGQWGGPNRLYAVIKFVIYTAAGSLIMLAGIIAVGVLHQQATGIFTLDLAALQGTTFQHQTEILLFLAFFAAFAVKVPLVPLHNWLPDAYTEAPTPVTIMLSGAMTKVGAFGFIRYCLTLFPYASHYFVPLISVLAVISILYCAVQALVQNDIKRLISYSSISHLGVVMLGIFALNTQGIEGGVLQMVNHGITTSALFLVTMYIEARAGTRNLQDFGGLAKRMPWFAVIFLIAALSSLGLPGLNSFSGEFLSLLGAFQANHVFGILGTLVAIPAAWYLLRFFQGVAHGPEVSEGPVAALIAKSEMLDIRVAELLTFIPLILLIFYIGFQPAVISDRLETAVSGITQVLSSVK